MSQLARLEGKHSTQNAHCAVLICLEKALMKRKINFWKFEFSRSPLCGRVLRVALPGKDQWLVEVGDAHSWKLGKRVM